MQDLRQPLVRKFVQRNISTQTKRTNVVRLQETGVRVRYKRAFPGNKIDFSST